MIELNCYSRYEWTIRAKDKVTTVWTRLHYEELYTLHASIHGIIMSKKGTAHEKCIQNFEARKELTISKHRGRQDDNIRGSYRKS